MAFVPERQGLVFAGFKAYLSYICFDPREPKGAVAGQIELPWLFFLFKPLAYLFISEVAVTLPYLPFTFSFA